MKFYFQRSEKGKRRVTDSKCPTTAHQVEKTCEVVEWITAKKEFGFAAKPCKCKGHQGEDVTIAIAEGAALFRGAAIRSTAAVP